MAPLFLVTVSPSRPSTAPTLNDAVAPEAIECVPETPSAAIFQ